VLHFTNSQCKGTLILKYLKAVQMESIMFKIKQSLVEITLKY